ncbi:alginate export family protein [Flavobacterium palustre]|uniref:Alginate export family protein n=1 Tax=Flavobacterium palustre TaxID=1476463 RepID=A0ABQ1HB80_9FLAO|nr:alginate export family protein [Flavobacterium palustre]GGA69174.1 alginate export family protein [Flavobacterium palustre]
MKKLILLFLITIQFGLAQNRLDFKSLRYDEDYSKIENDSDSTFLDRIKYIPLTKDENLKLSLGGELRSQYQYFNNENWGDVPNDSDGFLLNRALFHLDTKYKKSFRLFAQIQSSTAISRIDPSPVDKNELDIHQLFMDFNFQLNENDFTFRVGRQEFMYGSQRLVAVREGPNSRQAFDAVKMIWKHKNLKSDVFYSQFVKNTFGNFNDRLNPNTIFYGVNNVINKIPLIQNIDLYYLGLDKKTASFNSISGEEKRHSIGTRIWSKNKNWNYDFETVYQFGSIENQSIQAWTASLYTNYQFNQLKFKPKLGLKTELISGDKSTDDNKLQTFNPLFPRGAYFGLAAILGPSNLYDIHPSIELAINDRMSFAADYDFFWRFSKSDGIYQPNTTLIYSSANSTQRYIGSQLGASIDYDIQKWFSLKIEATWFKAGSYLKEVSTGKDIFFTAATLAYYF